MTGNPGNQNPAEYFKPPETGSTTAVEPDDDSSSRSDALTDEELVSHLLYVDAFRDQGEKRPAVAPGDAPSLFGLDGKPITSLGELDPSKPLLAESINSKGQKEIAAYATKTDFESGKPAARLVLEITQGDNGNVEKGTIFRGNSQEVISQRSIAHDANTFNLTFQVETKGETQKIVFNESGFPKQFELTKDGRKFEFKFDKDGNPVDIEDSQNPDRPIREPFKTMFLLAAKQSLAELKAAQGLPEPWREGDGIGENEGNGDLGSEEESAAENGDERSKPKEVKTETPATLEPPAVGDGGRLERSKALTAEETRLVGEAIQNLASPDFNTREKAQKYLKDMGDRALPMMQKAQREMTDPEGLRRLGDLVEGGINKHLRLPWDNATLHMIPPMTPEKLEKLDDVLKEIDLLSGSTARRQVKQEQLKKVPETLGVAIDGRAIDAVVKKVGEAGDKGSQLRIQIAEVLVKGGDQTKAQKYLLDAMEKQPGVVSDGKFLQAAVNSMAGENPDFVEAFKKAGGDMQLFERLTRPEQVRQGQSTDDLWNKFRITSGGTENKEPQDRIAEYMKLKSQPGTEEKRAGILADHYLAARNNQQRQQALDLLEAETKGGNQFAADYSVKLPLMAYAEAAFNGLPHGKGPLRFQNSGERLAEIKKQMKQLPSERANLNDVPELLTEHYHRARTPQEREEALELLKKEVQSGNLSAQFTLNGLTRMDAALKVIDGMDDRMRAANPKDFEAANKKIEAGIKEMAFVDHFRESHDSRKPGSLDYLTRRPTKGEEEALRRKGGKPKEAVPGPKPGPADLFGRAMRESNDDREKTVATLEALAEKFKGLHRGDDFKNAADLARTVFAAQDVLYGLGQPDKTYKGLLEIGKQAGEKKNPESKEFLDNLAKSGSAGEKLVKAINTKDEATALKLLEDPALMKAVGAEAKRFVDVKEPVDFVSGKDALASFGLLGPYGNYRAEAGMFDQKTMIAAEDAVNKYLARDTTGSAARKGLSGALPREDGAFRLDPGSHLKTLLQEATDKKALTPKVDNYARMLLSGTELTKEEVAELKKELQLEGEIRRASGLQELDGLSNQRVAYTGLDLQYTFNTLQSIEAARGVHTATKGALDVMNKGGGAVPTREALDKVIEQLRQLERLADNNSLHPLADDFYKKFGGKEAFEKLYNDIENGRPEQAKAALEKILKELPDGEAQASEFRALRVVRDLGPESTPLDFQKAAAELSREYDASLLESSQPNNFAVDWRKWSLASEQVSTITKAAAENKPDAAKAAVEALVTQAKDGNPYAKTALAAVIASDSNKIYEFLKAYPSTQEKPTYVPNLEGLNDKVRTDITKQALEGLLGVVLKEQQDFKDENGLDKFGRDKQGKEHKPDSLLTAQETMAVALGLSKFRQTDSGSRADQRTQVLFDVLLSHASYDVNDKGKNEVMKGLMAAMDSDRTSTRDIADYYIAGIDRNPILKEHFPKLQEMAVAGNLAALRVLAAITGGQADYNTDANPVYFRREGDKDVRVESNPISSRARATLEQAAASGPEARADVVNALLHINEIGKDKVWLADNNQLMAALGSVASRLDDTAGGAALRGVALEELRRSFNQNTEAMKKHRIMFEREIDPRDAVRYKSAFDGLLAMAPHWTIEEGQAFTQRLTPEVIKGLAQVGDKLNPLVAREILQRIEDRTRAILKSDSGGFWKDQPEELKANLKVMAALGAHANVKQVELLVSLGGDKNWKIEGKTPGAEILKQRFGEQNINDEQIRDVQAEAGRALLNILARSPNAPHPEVGPREAAYKAFKDLPWPIKTEDGKNWETSEKSRDLCKGLADYFTGHPYDVNLAKEIARIVDDAHLPKPAASLLAELNMGSIDPKDIGTGQTVWEKASEIIKHYSKNGENGEEVLRRVLANLSMVNSLPGVERAKLLGWDKLPVDDKKALGWFDQPEKGHFQHLGFLSLSSDKQAEIIELRNSGGAGSDAKWQELERKGMERWMRMSDAEKEAFRWQGVANVDVNKVMGQMFDGKLGDRQSNIAALLDKDLLAKVDTLRAEHSQKALDERRRRDDAVKQHNSTLADLVKTTKKGSSFGNQVIGLIAGEDGHDLELKGEQKFLIGKMEMYSNRIKDAAGKQATEERKAAELQLAAETNRHKLLVDSGEQLEADKLAIKMWKEHGPALAILAPKVWESLNVSSDGGLQGASSMKRLHKRGLTHFDMAPGYGSGRDGFRGALGLAECLNHNDNPPKERGLAQLRSDSQLLDTAALRAHMMQRVDQDKVLSMFSDSAREMNGPLNELSQMFDAASKGSKYEDFIDACKKRGYVVREQLNKISSEDLKELASRIKDMEEAVGKISDKTSRIELEDRINTYKKMHNMFNPGEVLYPEVAGKDKDGNVRNSYRETRELVKALDGMTPDGFSDWLKENGPIIGATIVAIAATVAACATFGVSSPLAVGAWVAVAGLVAREATKEVLYHINKDGYTGFGQYSQHGAEVGHWVREWPNRTPEERLKTFTKDVFIKYGVELVRDYVAFVATAGLSNYFFGSAQATAGTFQALSGAERAQIIQLANTSRQVGSLAATAPSAAARTYLTDFLKNFGKELLINSGFTVVQSGIEAPIHHAIGKEQMQNLGEWGQFGLSFALSTGLAMGAGARHSLKQGRMHPGGNFHFELNPGATREQFVSYMKREGFVVKPVEGKPGAFEVLPINAKPGTKPIKMQEVNSFGEAVNTPSAAAVQAGEPLKAAQREQPPKILGEPMMRPDGTELPPVPEKGGKPIWEQSHIDQFYREHGKSPESTQLLAGFMREGAPGDMIMGMGKDARNHAIELLKTREQLNNMLKEGKTPPNLTPEQWAGMRDSIDALFKGGTREPLIFGQKFEQMHAVVKQALELPHTQDGQSRAQALADLSGSMAKLPADFVIPERFLKSNYPVENLQRLAQLAKAAEVVQTPPTHPGRPTHAEPAAKPPATKDSATTEINDMVGQNKIPREAADLVIDALNKGKISPESAQRLAELHQTLGAEPFKKVLAMEGPVRDLSIKAIGDGFVAPSEIGALSKMASTPQTRKVLESILERPVQDGINYKEMFENLSKAGLSEGGQDALTFLIKDGVLPINELHQMLKNSRDALKSYCETHTEQINKIVELRRQMENSSWALLTRDLARMRDPLAKMNGLNGDAVATPLDTLSTQLQAALGKQQGKPTDTIPQETQKAIKELNTEILKLKSEKRSPTSLNEVLDKLAKLAPHEQALAKDFPDLVQALNQFRTKLGPLPEVQTKLGAAMKSEVDLKANAPELIKSLEALKTQLADHTGGDARAKLEATRDSIAENLKAADTYIRQRLAEFGIDVPPGQPVDFTHINQISNAGEKKAIIDLFNESKGVPKQLARLNEVLATPDAIDATIKNLQKFVKGEIGFDAIQADLSGLNGKLRQMQSEINTANKSPRPADYPPNSAYKDKATALAQQRQELLRGLTQTRIFDGGNNTIKVVGADYVWEGPVQANNQRPKIVAPKDAAGKPPDFTAPRPDTPSMKIDIIGTDGKPCTIEIPAGCRVEVARDAKSKVDGGAPEPNGLILHADHMVAADGSYLTFRIMQPKNHMDSHHVDYQNGYMRVERVYPKVKVNDINPDGIVGQVPLRVAVHPDGTPIMGIDGKPWVADARSKSIVHINELQGGTCPSELVSQRAHMNRIHNLYQGFSHFHVAPKALPPGTPTIAAPKPGAKVPTRNSDATAGGDALPLGSLEKPPGTDPVAWDMGRRMNQALGNDPALADWAYVPSNKSQTGVDGVFLNLKTGELRPIEFRNDPHAKAGDKQPIDATDPFVFRTNHAGGDMLNLTRDFLNRPKEHALTADVAEAIFGKGKTGLPDVAPEGASAVDFARSSENLRQHLHRLQEYCKAQQGAGKEIPAAVKLLTKQAEAAFGSVEAKTQLAHAVPDLITKALSSEPQPRVQQEGNQKFIELPFSENFTADPKVTRMFADKPPSETYKSVRVYEDGKVVAIQESGKTTELGNVRELFQSARSKAQVELAAQPSKMAERLGRIEQQAAHIDALLGRKSGEAAAQKPVAVEVTPVRLSPEFERVHSPEQIAKMSRAMEEGTKGWSDISEQAKRSEPYFKAEAKLQDLIAQETKRLEASGIKREDATRMATEKATQGPDSPLRRAYDECLKLRAANEPDIVAVEGRQRALQSLMDRITANEGIPKVQIDVVNDLGGNRGEYVMGEGRIRLRMSEVLNPEGGRKISDTIQHEFAHHRQDVLVVQAIARRLGAGHPPSVEQMAKIQAEYAKQTTSPLNEKFARTVLDKPPARPLSQAELTRATELAKSFAKMAENQTTQRQLNDLKTVLESHLSALERPTYAEALAKDISKLPAKAQEALLGENPSASLMNLIEKANRGTLTEKDANSLSRLLDATMRNRVRDIDRRLEYCEKVYLENMHEAETQEVSRRVQQWQQQQGAAPKPPEAMPVTRVENPQVNDAHRKALGDKLSPGSRDEKLPVAAQEDLVARRQDVDKKLASLPDDVQAGLKDLLQSEGTQQQKSDRLRLVEDTLKMDARARKEMVDVLLTGGKFNETQLKLVVDQSAVIKAEPNPVKRAINESKLSSEHRDAMSNYLEKHPSARIEMERLLKLQDKHLKEAGIEGVLKNPDSRPEDVSRAVRHAEALHRIEQAPTAIHDGLKMLLKGKVTDKRLQLVEDVLNAKKLTDSAEFLLKQRPEFLDDPETIKMLRREVPRSTEAPDAPQAKGPAVEISPELRRQSLNDSFDSARTNLEGYDWSPREIGRAKKACLEILAEHIKGAEPVEVVCGREQIGIVLRHPDGSKSVLKMHRPVEGPWNPQWGTRPHDAPLLPIGESGRKIMRDSSDGQKWTIYQQPFLDQPTPGDVSQFLRRTRLTGPDVGPAEVNIGQFGKLGDRVMVLDYGSVN